MKKTVFEMKELSAKRAKSGQSYLQFLNVPSMHCGVYHLKAGAKDDQSPHADDEIYYVEKGRGKFFHNDRSVEIRPGTILFVPAGDKHYFHDIEEDLNLLVFFARTQKKKSDATDGDRQKKSDSAAGSGN